MERQQHVSYPAGSGAWLFMGLFGWPYFVPTMQRATPGILMVPSAS
jgi:hypothetical protein